MGRGAAITGAGGALIYAGLLVVLASIVLLLIDAGVDPWLAALVVGGVALVIGAVVLMGRAADPRDRFRAEADGRDRSRERRVRQGAGEVTTERNDDERLPAEGAADLSVDDADAGSLTDEEQADAAEIRAEIEQTREEMGGTLNELGDRLEPGHLMDQAKENVRDATIGRVEETARGMSDMVMDTIKRNPVPAAMAGAGLALLWMNRSNGHDGYRSGEYRAYGSGIRSAMSANAERASVEKVGEVAGSVGDAVGSVKGRRRRCGRHGRPGRDPGRRRGRLAG